MSDCMTFPDTVEEFMEGYKIVDTKGIYMSKDSELVPIFRMKQWFEHLPSAQPERKNGKWKKYIISMLDGVGCKCSECEFEGVPYWNFCPNCGSEMQDEHTKNEEMFCIEYSSMWGPKFTK